MKPASERETFAIQYQSKENHTFYRFMTGIGPCFGGTRKDCMKFLNREDAARELSTFPTTAGLMAEIVRIAKEE